MLSLKWNDRISDLQEVDKKKLTERVSQAEGTAAKATQQLEEHAKRTAELEAKLRPKPFDERLRLFLDSVDKRILPRLTEGQLTVNGEMESSKAAEFRSLCAEPGAEKYVSILPPGPNDPVFAIKDNGTTVANIKFTLNTNLISSSGK